MRLQLPSSDDLWEADSAQAWASLHPSRPLAPLRKSFGTVLGLVFGGNGTEIVRRTEDQWHRHFIILTLARMVWSWKEVQTAPGVWFGRFPMDKFQETKHELLRILEVLRHAMSTDLSHLRIPSSTEIVLRNSLVVHMSHLYAADDLMDWFYPMIHRGHVAARWKARAKLWASQNPVKVRDTAYHGAQILAIARRFPSNFITEVFGTFHAGLCLWLISSLWQEDQDDSDSRAQEHTPAVCLDQLGHEPSGHHGSITVGQWIRDESVISSTRVCIHGVPDLAGPNGPWQVLQQAAKLLERMKVWRISRNLLDVVLRLFPDRELTSP